MPALFYKHPQSKMHQWIHLILKAIVVQFEFCCWYFRLEERCVNLNVCVFFFQTTLVSSSSRYPLTTNPALPVYLNPNRHNDTTKEI